MLVTKCCTTLLLILSEPNVTLYLQQIPSNIYIVEKAPDFRIAGLSRFFTHYKLSVAGMAGGMGQAGMGSYYGPAAAYSSLSAASMAAAAAAAAQQSAAAMSAGLAAPAQVSRCIL